MNKLINKPMNKPTNKPHAVIKQAPSDFFVAENLNFPLSGAGEHLWLYVEKTGLNTAWVKREWAKMLGIAERDIAHSGLKDRHAVTRQWFSLPAKSYSPLQAGEGWKILDQQLNSRKLRIGSHASNNFVIILREIDANHSEIDAKIREIDTFGFANYFGKQRFGQHNVEHAFSWVKRKKLPRRHNERARTLSVLRSFCFNAQVSARENAGNLLQITAGDRAMLAGTNSHFAVTEMTPEIMTRLASGDIAPAGWLAGKGDAPEQADLAAVVKNMAEIVDYLNEFADAGWRALTVRATGLNWQWLDDNTLKMQFTLPRGSYATALLGEIFTLSQDLG